MLNKLSEIITTDYNNISGIVVMKSNKMIYENYLGGVLPSDSIHIASVTKSITSLLCGIAIDQGFIKSVDQKVIEFFPNYVKKRGENLLDQVTIKHLLTMTAPYKFKSEPYTKVYSSEDWTKSALDLLGGKGTIGNFKYTTIGTHILSGIIEKSTGMSLLDFAMKYLFTSLGISRPSQVHISDRASYMEFMKYTGSNAWVCDSVGSYTAGWGLTLNARALSKIGQLVLDEGFYQGKQLVSTEWIYESTKVWSHHDQLQYGYMWWVIDDTTRFAAVGDGGNLIYIAKDLNLVVAITSSFIPRSKDRIKFIEEHIICQIDGEVVYN